MTVGGKHSEDTSVKCTNSVRISFLVAEICPVRPNSIALIPASDKVTQREQTITQEQSSLI